MISFIVPVYNTEKYIEKCIESIISSGIKDFEIIIINDGSTDNSFNICKLLKKKYEDIITLINQRNQGVSKARNKGLDIAKGDWIIFVDSDDYIFTGSLSSIKLNDEVQLYLFEYSNDKDIDEEVANDIIEYKDKENEVLIDCIFNAKSILKERKANVVTPWAKIYKKSVIDNNNLRFIEELPIGEDMLFNLNYISKCSYSIYITRTIYHVEERVESASRKFNPNKLEHDKIFNNYLKKALLSNNNYKDKMYIYYDNVIVSYTECLFISLELNLTKQEVINQFSKVRKSINDKDVLKGSSNSIGWYRKIMFYLLCKEKYSLLLSICKKIRFMRTI